MTLNQIISRIRSIALAHKQVRNFYFGIPTDFLTDKTTRYPSAFLQYVPGNIDLVGKTVTLAFKLYLLDLVHVSENTAANELDVQSDMLEVAKDMIATMNYGDYADWKVSVSNPVTLLRDKFDDLVAGVVVDVSISTMYDQDVCRIPTDDPLNFEDMKLVYDLAYIATGEEGKTLTTTGEGAHIPTIAGKKVLHLIRENAPQHKVTFDSETDPASGEFMWNNVIIKLGTDLNQGERLLFLWRNY